MAYTSWRGVIGVIKPTHRPGSLEEMIRLLPEGIGVIPTFLDVRRGTKDEFMESLDQYEKLIAELAEQKVDLILPEGAGPFTVMGYKKEAALIRSWEKKYKTPMFGSAMNQVSALKAMKVKNLIVGTYSTGVSEGEKIDYFLEAGIKVAGVVTVPVAGFDKVGQLSPHEVYARIKAGAIKHPKADGILLRGSGWRTLGILELLEQDLGIPTVHAVTARVWEVQKRLHVRQPVQGYGRILAELP